MSKPKPLFIIGFGVKQFNQVLKMKRNSFNNFELNAFDLPENCSGLLVKDHEISYLNWRNLICIPKPVWAVGFALEQPLHVVALTCSASGILKQLEHIRYVLMVIIASFIILPMINFVPISGYQNLCCANEAEDNSPSHNELIETGKFKDAYDILKKLILNPQDPESIKYIAKYKVKKADTIGQAVDALNVLNCVSEIDELLEQALSVHKNDWRVLEQIAMSYARIVHNGVIIDNKFQRGYPERGRDVFVHQRDHVQALIIFKQAMPLVLKEDNKNDVAQFFINWSDVIYITSLNTPQSLTNISELPDYSEEFPHNRYGRHYNGNMFSAVDVNGQPIFYGLPESFESAQNDGERWRWTLEQAAKICPEKFLGITLKKRAVFNNHLFGTSTLSGFWGDMDNRDTEKTASIWSLSSLSDDETITKTAAGIKRFNLPDEHNYIKLCRESCNNLTGKEKLYAEAMLADLYKNRRQFVKAAEILSNIIEEFSNDKSLADDLVNYRNQFEQITGNWGRFENEGSEVKGLNASFKYTFRNGNEVKLTAYEIDLNKLITQFKSQAQRDTVHSVSPDGFLSSFARAFCGGGYFLGEQVKDTAKFRQKFFIGKAAEWTEKLTPAKNHFNADTIIKMPIKKSGLFFIEAVMKNGNTTVAFVWLNDTAIVQEKLQNKVIYLVTDAETGQPLKNVNLELFSYYRQENRKSLNDGKVRFVLKQFGAKSDSNGIAQFPLPDFPSNSLQGCFIVAKGENDRLAVLGGIDYFLAGRQQSSSPQGDKAFVITDRPVYRPQDKVEIKVWIGNRQYDQPDKNKLAGQKINYKIYDPKHVVVREEKNVELDSYGGFTAVYELPKGATLGTYSVAIGDPSPQYGYGYFRVEEYKKPEYEVLVDSPKEPIKLGDKFKVTVRAKYYFGSPVTEATVKYSVLRSIDNSAWYPVRYWDWLYGNGYSWFAYDSVWMPNWSKWGCCRPAFYWHYRDTPQPELVVTNETKIGEDGTVTFEVDSSLAKFIHPDNSHKYQITAEITDNSRRTIVGNGVVLAAHEPFKIYAYTDRGYYTPDQKINAHFNSRRIDGKTVKGNGEVTLYKISYKKNTQNDNDKFDIIETKVYSENVTFNDDGFAKLSLNAVSAGQYKISCVLDGQEGGYVFNVYPNTKKTQVAENNNANESWKFNAIELIPDKAEFAPGENLNLRINTKKENSFVYLLIRSEYGIVQSVKLIKLDGNSTQISIPVDVRDMPNFFIDAVTVVGGRMVVDSREIVVPPQKRVLNVEVQPDAENYKPGVKAKAKLIVTDIDNKPVVGQVAISVYDKSVEYISAGSNIADIKEFFWKWKRYNNKNFLTNLREEIDGIIADHMSDIGDFGNVTVEEAAVYSADFNSGDRRVRDISRIAAGSGGAAVMMKSQALNPAMSRSNKPENISENGDEISGQEQFIEPTIRKNFADTAFWNGVIETDKDGVVTVEFAMPESLTTWKINVWSMAQGTRVGYGSTQVITRKDLIVRMQTPRFFVEKDQVLLTANVHNYLKSDKNVLVQLETDGDLIVFDKAASSKNVKIAANGEAKIDWLVDAKKAGDAKIRMLVKTGEESDAMEKVLPVYVHGILKQEAWSGYIAPDRNSNTIEINVPAERRPEQTKLTLRYSPTLAMSMVDALPYLAEYPYGCTEQTLNRFLPAVMVQKVLIDMNIDLAKLENAHTNLNAQELGTDRKPAFVREFLLQKKNPVYSVEELRAMVNEGVEKLRQMQCSDGGWGWFGGNGERSSGHLTALVLHGLILARDNDVKIDPNVIEHGKSWLVRYQADEVTKIKNYLLPKEEKENKVQKPYADTTDAFVLMVLGEIESNMNNRNNNSAFYKSYPNAAVMREFLWRDRGKLSPYGNSMLGIFESSSWGNMDRAKDCVKILEQYLVNDDENQTAYLNLRKYAGWYWWCWDGSEFETQAYYLKLLMQVDAKSPVAPRIVKYLLNNRRHANYWNSTRDTAICIEAFAEYLKQTGESKPDLTVEILFDGEIKKTIKITPENIFEIGNTFVLSADEISTGSHKIEFRKRNNSTTDNNKIGNSPLYFNAYLENFTLEDSIKGTGLEVKVSRRLYLLERDDSAKAEALGSRGQVVEQRVEKYKRVTTDKFKSGDLIEVELIVESKNDYESILVGDWKCAGFEPVAVRSGYNGNELGAYVEFRDERVLFFVYRLLRGKHSVTYRLRAEQSGNFSALPTQIEAMYTPELKANSDENKIKITERKF
jgi:uncharacterized protein YfaS (alpha-2-macroglobulin family)